MKSSSTQTTVSRLVPDSLKETPSSSIDQPSSSMIENEQIQNLKKRIQPNLKSLENCYFEIQDETLTNNDSQPVGSLGHTLDKFSSILNGISKYTKVKRLATLNNSVESFPNSSIVSRYVFNCFKNVLKLKFFSWSFVYQ